MTSAIAIKKHLHHFNLHSLL